MNHIVRYLFLVFLTGYTAWAQGATLTNSSYRLEIAKDGTVLMNVAGLAPQRLIPEFTVLESEHNPGLTGSLNHDNYLLAPRYAMRWTKTKEPASMLNAWLASPEMKEALGGACASVRDEPGGGRVWEYRTATGELKLRVSGVGADGTTRPFAAARNVVLRAVSGVVAKGRLKWAFPEQANFALSAVLTLSPDGSDPEIAFELTPKKARYYSVAFTGAPGVPIADVLPVPQECSGRGYRQFDFVMGDATMKCPRVMASTRQGSIALAASPCECAFRLPARSEGRFGLMLAHDAGNLKPVLLAPLLGCPESRMKPGQPWRFSFRVVTRAGDWKETFRRIARSVGNFRDQRDASGPGSLNACLEHVMDFLADRNGRNYAMWHDEQKYYDYFTDQTGIFKPFSPIYGLSAAVVTDDEDFFRRRARPAVEYALSRKTNYFAPYEQLKPVQPAALREIGGPYIGYAQRVSLNEFFQRRVPSLLALPEHRGSGSDNMADALARWQLTGERAALDVAVKTADALVKRGHIDSEQQLFDLLELYSAVGERKYLGGAIDAAYDAVTSLNLSPTPPDTNVTVDTGGQVPVHSNSFPRHLMWGFEPPQPLAVPEMTVPAWRVARLGLPSPAYPIEYWMNVHGALLRTAALGQDDFLRDVARWGMVGRFGNYPGDNRTQISLVGELPDAVDRPPWDWNFATVNPGHAWDFAGAVLDYLVTDAFDRSRGAIDFPAESTAGSTFRVRTYGARPGRFYGAQGVRLWLPRGLVATGNKQLDWLAGYGNGRFYLALWSQSFREEHATVSLNRAWVECQDGDALCCLQNQSAPPARVASNQLTVTLPAKGVVAFAIPATVKPRFQATLYAKDAPQLSRESSADTEEPFGKIHAMLLTAGRGLTSAFVYTEAPPENVIAARLRWRQGNGVWHELIDKIYPYEFSTDLAENAGDFQCVFEVQNSSQQVQQSRPIQLKITAAGAAPAGDDIPKPTTIVSPPIRPASKPAPIALEADFLAYLKTAANRDRFGLRNGRFYPYSTPLGRRIGFRQLVWDQSLFADGCTPEKANEQLKVDLADAADELRKVLAARTPALQFDELSPMQREILLDFANSEGAAHLRPEFVTAVLATDWSALMHKHLYVRYAGPAPDHTRNRAFVERWSDSDRFARKKRTKS